MFWKKNPHTTTVITCTSLKRPVCLYLLGQNCLHLTLKPYWSSESYSRKYEKLPNIVIHECTNIYEQMNLLKMCGTQIRLCLFTFRLIASKWLNSLTTIDTLTWLGGADVTHPLWVRESPVSITGSGKCFYVWSFCFVVVVFFTFCPETHYLSHTCATFCDVHLFNILNIFLDLRPIIRA